MTVAVIKKKLMDYLEEADAPKIKALYTLLENEIESSGTAVFSKEQLAILEEEHALHMSGQTRSYSWEEAKEIIRGKKKL